MRTKKIKMDMLYCPTKCPASIGVYSYMLGTEKEINGSNLLPHRPGHLISVQIFKTQKLQTVY